MLIYNYRKEFIGIDENTLRRLGYNNMDELKEDVADFADLFENRPGYIHNFKNFSWIDFIIHSEQDDIKARIRCNGKIYSCGFKVENFFLTQEEQRGFSVTLTELQAIGDDDGSQPRELYEPETPQALQAQSMAQESLDTEPQPLQMIDEEFSADTYEPVTVPEIEPEPMALDIDMDMTQEESFPEPQSIEPLDIMDEPALEQEVAIEPMPAFGEPAPIASSNVELATPADYVYDPSVAADELGLPADLIDEFVGDFIVQAKKFRPDIEEAVLKEDFDTVQILSHKLKGVAANLRIEDALEVLTIINTSKDTAKLQEYLNTLFAIIHKLEFGPDTALQSGAETPAGQTHEAVSSIDPEDDDLYSFDLIQEPLSDSDEPAFEDSTDTMDIEPLDFEPMDESSSVAQDLDSPDLVDDMLPIEDIAKEAIVPEKTLTEHDPEKFDIQKASQNLDMPIETLKEYVNEFVDQANNLKSELEDALTSQNFEQVQQVATQLKGISQTLHMDHATQLLSTLQTTSDIKEAIASAKELFVFIREL